jgi:GNAT superfamily N-acetyltransferase
MSIMDGSKPSIQKSVVKRNVSSMTLRDTTRQEFVSHITEDKADSFAKTFVAKADMQEQWQYCIGCWDGGELAGAIITTRSKRIPYVFNLQLLHTFAKHRRKGVARLLTQDSLDRAQGLGTSYYRVSAEPDAVVFYESMGFKFLGKQKSGCSLSMFKINGKNFADGIYDLSDPVIHAAVYKKGKGGCVQVY